MYRKPNEGHIVDAEDTYKSKGNQIWTKFSDIFKILLNPEYYEGTRFASYYNRIVENSKDAGKSRIYVYDPLEKVLEQMEDEDCSQVKYLVGLTGMGKTTLLRNHFRIVNRDVILETHRIVIYISYFNANLSVDKPQESVEKETIQYLKRTIDKLLMNNKWLIENIEDFVAKYYDFIMGNKATLLSETPSSIIDYLKEIQNSEAIRVKDEKLQRLRNESPIEYYCSLLKYILQELSKKEHIKKVIFIYDDIEAKKDIFHSPLIEVARHIHACLCASEMEDFYVKTIISLRAYTFRENIGRQNEARRQYIENDTILKKETVNLRKIYERRFMEIAEIEETRKQAKSKQSYDDAQKVLLYLMEQMDRISKDMIYNLVNYNLCDAMLLYSRILTNIMWIACGEKEREGSFVLDEKSYRLTQETILNAVANGNKNFYTGRKNSYVPNLLYNDINDTNLVGLYIIRYFRQKEQIHVYGEKYTEGSNVVAEIAKVLSGSIEENVRLQNWKKRVHILLEYYYKTGVLFRSVYDIAKSEESQTERIYRDDYKLYLSPRGLFLYSLFKRSAVLLELYRDDICTELADNDKLTCELGQDKVFEYLLHYVKWLFQCEKANIANATLNLDKYQEVFGNEFIVCDLLEGIARNLSTYYQDDKSPGRSLLQEVCDIQKDMSEYATLINQKYRVKFVLTNDLNSAIDYAREAVFSE